MRLFFPIFLLGILMSGPVGASSFVPLKRYEKPISPSIIYFGEPEPATPAKPPAEAAAPAAPPPFHRPFSFDPPPELAGGANGAPDDTGSTVTVVSPSVIALGPRKLDIDFSQVASLGKDERPRDPHLPPMVIRGGIFGDAFTRGDGGGSAPSQPQSPSAPKQQVVSNPDNGTPTGAKPPQPKQPSGPQPTVPAAIQPPAPPTGKME